MNEHKSRRRPSTYIYIEEAAESWAGCLHRSEVTFIELTQSRVHWIV